MKGSTLVAIVASFGNFLQGWDNATIAGAIVYIKADMGLETTVEGVVVAMSLVGATLITTCSGVVSDSIGRRPMLILSSVLYFLGGLVMLWSPNVYVLCTARVLAGFGIGLAVTLVPIYISETAPPDVRGLLNTLPQFMGSGGMFVSYCMVFGMSLLSSPSWRLMLGVLSIPSLAYFAFTVFYLPESPRWLVSKGKMVEAKRVLQRLRGVEDVSGEMALLVEGLGIGGESCIEEYIISPDPEEGHSLIGKHLVAPSSLSPRSLASPGVSLMDPLVTLFDSVHEMGSTGSMRSLLSSNLGSMYSVAKHEQWDEESSVRGGGEDYASQEADDNLHSPLISRQATSMNRDMVSHGSVMRMTRHSSSESIGSTSIGGGWKLAWKWNETEGEDGKKEGVVKRMYFRQVLAEDEAIQSSAALVSQPALGSAMLHPFETASKAPLWSALLEPGVNSALMVGIGIQILQQFSGINGVLYYTPQILEEAGVEVLLSDIELSSDSASFLISAFTTLLMLPCIAVAMRLMDVTGRRKLLLATIPVLVVSLIVLVLGNVLNTASVIRSVISTVCVVVYFCCFVMAYGPIPNILCSEIFPTRVRGLCIAICSLVFWICDIIVTYTLPVMLSSIGLAGVFGIYAVVCVISWIFIFLKVPETKGMPLEVINEFFAIGAKQAAEARNE